MSEGATARVPVTRRRVEPRAVLAIASLGAGLAFVDATIVNVAFPDIVSDFEGSTLGGVSWVLNAYNIVFAAFMVAAGRVADLLGRKRLFEVGIVLFGVASVLCAVAPSVELLVVARVVQALGAAIVVPASLALVLHAYEGAERAHGVALWSASAALAAGLGPSLGGVLVDVGGWRLAFLVNIPIAVGAVVLARRTLVESRAPGRRSVPDLAGALLLAAAISVLTLGIVKGDEWGWAGPATLACLVVAAVLAAAVARRCAWHPSPMIDPALLRVRSLAVANALSLVGAAGFYAYVLCNVLFLTAVWGYSVLEAGLAITPGPFVAAAVAGPASRLAARVGPGPVLAVGGFVWAAAVAYLVRAVGGEPDFVGEWLPGMVLLGLGAGLAFPVAGAAAVAGAPGERFATATALNSVARQLGAVVGVALLVAIVSTPGPDEVEAAFDRGWTFAAVCFLVVAIGGLAIGRVAVAEPAAEPPPAKPRAGRSRRPGPTVVGGSAPRTDAPVADAPSAVEVLSGVPLFASLAPDSLERLAVRVAVVGIRARDWLVRQGDPCESVYVVASGRLDVVLDGLGERILWTAGAGDMVGELAALSGSVHSASVRARRDTRLLELPAADFLELATRDAPVGGHLLRTMATRLQASGSLAPAGRPRSTLAVVALDDRAAFGEVVEGLRYQLAVGGPTNLFDGPAYDDEADEALRLERYEHHRDHVLLAAAELDSDWASFCLRHADRVVAVAGRAPISEAVRRRRDLRGCDLVLDGVAGEEIAAALDSVAPRAHHLLPRDAGRQAALARAGRRLAGRSVGLVLSGGGARALAHIGVIDELLAAGIAIDRVGGCSMGAFVGGLLAQGMGPDEIDARCYEEWVRRRPFDYRLPRRSLLRGERGRRALERNFPGAVESLPLDFFTVSADLVSREQVVHRRGALLEAVGFSMALPGLVEPQRRDERILVDGGVLNNLPVDVMAATGEGPVVASDVTGRFDPPGAPGGLDGASDAEPPSLGETLTRALLLGSSDTARLAREHAALAIAPDSDGVGMLEWHQLDRLRENGRRAAAEALDRAPETLFG